MLATVLTVLVSAFALASAAHAVQYKRDTRAVIAWVWFIILLPLAGAVLYWLLGVNRIQRRAGALRAESPHLFGFTGEEADCRLAGPSQTRLATLTARLSPFPLVAGNRVTLLADGDAAYPPMLEAIESASRSVALSTYIFDDDAVGREFADALERAAARGVEVRVLVDGVGARYSRRDMIRRLRRSGVECRAFLPVYAPRSIAAFNMRNHRKILVTDGRRGFTGGINLRAGHRLADAPPHPVHDLHFGVEGPVVAQLQQVFADDWHFATGEHIGGEAWFPRIETAGDAPARGLPDGPDDHFEALRMARLGALAEARERVLVATPYFLPDAALIAALNTAALRGIGVDILIPEQGNLKLVQWASTAQLWQVLERGCRVWLTPPPFDHSKVFVVDDHWSLVGSANWDPRSLRLNFEFELETYDTVLAGALRGWGEARMRDARRVTLEEVDARPVPVRLRDGAARLLTPYL